MPPRGRVAPEAPETRPPCGRPSEGSEAREQGLGRREAPTGSGVSVSRAGK